MPARRKSDALHQLHGTVRPDRGHGRDLAPGGDVGFPPEHLADGDLAAWHELRESAPWLGLADRHALELAARAVGALRRSPEPPPALLAQVGRALDRIACSTSSRGESAAVRTPAAEAVNEESPLAALIRKGKHGDGRPPRSN